MSTRDRTVLVHNPRCSKSRSLADILRDRKVDFVERLYLVDPLREEELVELARQLDKPLRECVRTKEEAYRASGLAELSADEQTNVIVRRAILAHPELLERPILIHEGRARIGRPPEDALELLGDD